MIATQLLHRYTYPEQVKEVDIQTVNIDIDMAVARALGWTNVRQWTTNSAVGYRPGERYGKHQLRSVPPFSATRDLLWHVQREMQKQGWQYFEIGATGKPDKPYYAIFKRSKDAPEMAYQEDGEPHKAVYRAAIRANLGLLQPEGFELLQPEWEGEPAEGQETENQKTRK